MRIYTSYLSALLIILVWISLAAVGCKNSNTATTQETQSTKPTIFAIDSTINADNAYFAVFLDSTQIKAFLEKNSQFSKYAVHISNFYRDRNFEYAWYDSTGLNEHSAAFMSRLLEHIELFTDSSENAIKAETINDLVEKTYWGDDNKSTPDTNTELLLTSLFFQYAAKEFEGDSETELKDLGWYIPKKKLSYEEALTNLVNGEGTQGIIHPQYNKMRDCIIEIKKIQPQYDQLEPLTAPKKPIRPNTKSPLIPAIRQRLAILKDLPKADSSDLYSPELVEAVVNFRKRHGLPRDTAIGKDFIEAINVPLAQRLRTMYINLERLRWLPTKAGGEYLLVNVPEYKLHAFNGNDSLLWSMRVVVGKTSAKTELFKGQLNTVVFSPYWYVPRSIITKEILPDLKKNPSGYLKSHDMEIVRTPDDSEAVSPSSIEWNTITEDNFPYILRQKPGEKNALGKVKFLFPNQYSIYMHDTPSKKYFNDTDRAFSHGCIRVAEPQKLAKFVLKDNKAWTSEKIDSVFKNTGEKEIQVKSGKIPVTITYFTSWVDSKGNLNFRNDIYERDKNADSKLFNDNVAMKN